jgi:hypothetical protein
MSSPKKCIVPTDKLELYEELVRTNPKVERKGAANPYTSLNGHMFTYMNPAGSLALRLPEGERETFLKKYKTTLFEAYGVIMKEYVKVPESLLKNTKALQPYFLMSYEYIKTFKPKPTARKKK